MSLPLPGGNGLNCYNTIPSHEMDASVVSAAIKCQAEVAGVVLRSTYSSTRAWPVRVPERRHDLARSMPGASVDRTTGLRPTRRQKSLSRRGDAIGALYQRWPSPGVPAPHVPKARAAVAAMAYLPAVSGRPLHAGPDQTGVPVVP
jgi:hypothetical protein